ncbi:MAG TPA: TraR/DksA C4-type zinc finger protein [Ktedonobacterales bacterium]|jgi:DnaK suppressor protein|nr:TraR/DksA C4-type zinc finger protein [Ktedonobacterales bacterium]
MDQHLTPDELAELHGLLEQKRTHLRAQLADLARAEGAGTPPEDEPLTDAPEDTEGDSVDLQEQDTDRALGADLREALVEVEHALSKFDKGTYGLCEVCGRPIPLARLRVLPEARYDAQHQAEVEAQQARRGQ